MTVSSPTRRPRPGDDRPRRRYDASRRRAAAEERRVRIVDVAGEMFAELGWTHTTIAKIAAAAGVSSELVSTAFGSKAALLYAAFQRAGWGSDGMTLLEYLEQVGFETEPDRERRLEMYVDFSLDHLNRAASLVQVIEVAADQDAWLAEEWRAAQERHVEVCRYLVDLLAVGPTRPEAVEELFLFTRGQTYFVLTRNRGWTDEQYRAWLMRVVPAALAPA